MSVELFQETKIRLLGKRSQKLHWTEERRKKEEEHLRSQYHDLLCSTNSTPLAEKMIQLRKLVIDLGLPEESDLEREHYATKCSLRGTVWKILLGALKLDADHYCQLVELGPCSDDKKIRADTFRTYKNNATFWSRVDESKLSRVLTVCSRTYSQNSSPDHSLAASRAIYVQGMNVLVAPFLFLMPEVDAYTAFMALISRHCPRYVVSNLDGVHHGCSLVDRTLEILDPVLHRHIIEKKLKPEIFAFPYTMTLLANMSPLPEVIRLWDAIFAFGIHFDILLITCHLMLMREDLLAEQQGYQIQKMIVQEPLDSELLVGCTLQMIRFIPASLFEELISHPVEKARNISQVLSREYQLSTRAADDDERSVSSQGASKTIKRRPLSGRLTKRPGTPNEMKPPNFSSTSSSLSSSASAKREDAGERGMSRSSSNGRTKIRTRSRSRSRGRAKTRVGTPSDGAASDLPIPRRIRVNSTSRIPSEKAVLGSSAPSLGSAHRAAATSPPCGPVSKPKSPAPLSPWK